MVLIEWKLEYNLGIQKSDSDHKILIDIINELAEHMKTNSNKENLIIILKKLEEYSKDHFKYEEEIFDKYNYEDSEKHKIAHENFIKKMDEIINRLKKPKDIVTYDLLDYLEDWWIGHIKIIDRKYVPFFKEKGIQ